MSAAKIASAAGSGLGDAPPVLLLAVLVGGDRLVFGHRPDQLRDDVAEALAHGGEIGLALLDHVVQQRRGEHLVALALLDQQLGDRDRMVDEGPPVAAAAQLTGMRALRCRQRLPDQIRSLDRGVDARSRRHPACQRSGQGEAIEPREQRGL